MCRAFVPAHPCARPAHCVIYCSVICGRHARAVIGTLADVNPCVTRPVEGVYVTSRSTIPIRFACVERRKTPVFVRFGVQKHVEFQVGL